MYGYGNCSECDRKESELTSANRRIDELERKLSRIADKARSIGYDIDDIEREASR